MKRTKENIGLQRVVSGVLLALALMAPSAALAELEVKTVTNYYDVEGRRGPELLEELERKMPSGAFQAKHFASTRGDIDWKYNFDRNGDECRLESVDVTLELTYHMPRWQNRERARKNVIRAWDHFIEALWQHEEYHGSLFTIGAQSIHDSLLPHIDPAPDCSTIAKQFQKYANMQLKEVSRAQMQFDMRTRTQEMGLGLK